jgi:hypothetical protein
MHPRIVELNEYLGQQRGLLTAAVAQIATSRHRDAPAAGRWSVVNVLEHLAIVERGLAGRIGNWIDEARGGGLARETDVSPILPTINLERFVDRSRPVKTSAANEPTGTVSVEEAMRALSVARASTREVLASGSGYALATVSHDHPTFGPMHLYEWIAFIGGHECRHAMQIREIGVALARR